MSAVGAVTAVSLKVQPYDDQQRSTLLPAEGRLLQIFEIGFAVAGGPAPQVIALQDGRSAMTADGSVLEVVLDSGVPHPRSVLAATLHVDAKPDPSRIGDFNLPPRNASKIAGKTPSATFRIASNPTRYVGVWNRSGRGSLVALFDTAAPNQEPKVMARSQGKVLGVAVQPDMDATKTYFTVWTAGTRPGQYVIGLYGWTRGN